MSSRSAEPVIFTDLDDSLFQTRRKSDHPHLTPVAYGLDGREISFQTPQQRALVELFGPATMIPVTGRSAEALSRASGLTWTSYRVVSHGALILDESGRALPSWLDETRAEVEAWRGRLEALCAELSSEQSSELSSELARDPLRVRLVAELVAEPVADLNEAQAEERSDEQVDGQVDRQVNGQKPRDTERHTERYTERYTERHTERYTYLSVKGPRARLAELALTYRAQWRDGVIHHNDRNLAFLPSYASKERAVAHLMAIIEARLNSAGREALFIGVGDSVSDLPFMKRCHFALTPRDGQIQEERW